MNCKTCAFFRFDRQLHDGTMVGLCTIPFPMYLPAENFLVVVEIKGESVEINGSKMYESCDAHSDNFKNMFLGE